MPILLIAPTKDPNPWVKALKTLDPGLDIRIYPQDKDKEEVDFALTWKHPEGAFLQYPNLKCIASMGAGVDHLTKDPFLPKNVVITRIIDRELTQSMSEFILSLVMNQLRGLNHYQKDQHKQVWAPQAYQKIADVKIGIMGMGVLGKNVALLLKKSGFKIFGWTESAKWINGVTVFYGERQFPNFLSKTDILICLLPLTPATYHILNQDTFQMLPQGAFIINVSRGDHLVEEDLIRMIDNGHLAGASLDVFKKEPLPRGHPFWSHPKINITPHVASLTNPEAVAPQILSNYHRMKKGKTLQHTVSLKKGY